MEESIIFESNESFSLPTAIVDKYLDAPQEALRLILFLIRNKNVAYRKEDLSGILKCNNEELEMAFKYWENCGFLYKYNGRYRLDRPKVSTSDIIKYSPQKVSERINSDPSVGYLFKKTEQMLSKPLSNDDAAGIISIVDWIGLPADVTALLIEYVSGLSQNKKTIRNMVKIASEWEEMGFDSFEKADKYIVAQKEKNSHISRISSLLGIKDRILSDREKICFSKWTDDYHFDENMIMEAYSRTINSTGKYSINYMDKILSSWHESGISRVEEIPEYQPGVEKQKKKPYAESSVTSEDEESQISESWNIIKKKKREKDGR